MSRSFNENNRLNLDLSYQNIDSFVFNENNDIESISDKNDKSFEKVNPLNRIYKEQSPFQMKTFTQEPQNKYDNISVYNTRFMSSYENNIYSFCEDIFPMYIPNNLENSNKNKKIFEIIKINKKIGRIKKNSILKGVHNKLSEDNIIRKIKGRFLEKLRLYINNEYKKYLLLKSNKKNKNVNWLKKINPKLARRISKEENIKWFNTKIYEIFSENVSIRYASQSPDSNKKRINKLISSNNAKNVISILNSNIDILFEKYINDEEIEGFKTLKDDINELEANMENTEKENIKEYLKRYEYIAKNMKNIFNRKNARHNTSKLNSIS